MKKIQIEVPDSFSKIDPKLRDELLARTLRKVAVENLKEKRKELKNIKKRLSLFEKKYNCEFKDFETNFPKNASHEVHEDWVEWSFWNELNSKVESFVKELELALNQES
jgi:hypothetical protein